jgi:long-chain acyl-CoA synthetase
MAGFLNNLLCPFMAGASVVLGRPFYARAALDFWKPIIKHGADSFWLVPTILAALLKIDRDSAGLEYCRKHVKTIFVGTAPLPLKIKNEFENKYGVELFESYGLSELLIITCNSRKFLRLQGSVGPVLPGVQLRIANERGESVRPEEDGAVWVRTPCIMAGYLNYQTLEPDRTSPADWFPTGDIGRLNAQGYLFITGREKDLIIRGGINVSPVAIEEILLEHESVEQIAVVGLPHDFYGEEVVAVVKLKTGYELKGVRPFFDALCKEKLNANSIPTTYIEIDQFPVSSTGKIQKVKLREVVSARLNRITMGAPQI